MRYSFITSILFTLIYSLQIITKEMKIRMNLIVPVMILFFATFLLFAIEYDKKRSLMWKSKEKKLIEKVYGKFVKVYLNRPKHDEDFEKYVKEEKEKWLQKRLIEELHN